MYLTHEGWWVQIQGWISNRKREGEGKERKRETVWLCAVHTCVSLHSVRAYAESKIHLVSGTEHAGNIVKMIILNLLIIFLMVH